MPKARLSPLSVFALLLAGSVAGCSSASDGADSHDSSPHFSYAGAEGPSHWGDLSSAWKTCSTGTEQSPIALTTGTPRQTVGLEVDYPKTVAFESEDNGHTVQLTPKGDGYVTADGDRYDLAQFHFHAPSEHEIDGEKADAEFHFVHEDDDGDLLVVSVLAKKGVASAAWQPFTEAAGDEQFSGDINLAALLPDSLDHFSYEGSLTTPPCTEGVKWVVLETPIELGAAQLDALREAHNGNDRPLQPLNDRSILTVAE